MHLSLSLSSKQPSYCDNSDNIVRNKLKKNTHLQLDSFTVIFLFIIICRRGEDDNYYQHKNESAWILMVLTRKMKIINMS